MEIEKCHDITQHPQKNKKNIKRTVINSSAIPLDILDNDALNQSISALLPSNYNFEIHKTIHQIRQNSIKSIALQLPEGLQMYASAISFILEKFSYPTTAAVGLDIVILADVTYGACCIDDLSARALGCDMIVHYGHSCLVPITTTTIRTLYVFVDIQFDIDHLRNTLLLNMKEQWHLNPSDKIAFVSTIQFSSSLHFLLNQLKEQHGYHNAFIPQEKPLSPGEVLGCTSPKLPGDTSLVVYVGDGRFHLESIMIANPHLHGRFYRYDPYEAKLTREWYEMEMMLTLRRDAIQNARVSRGKWAVVLGTLGRQGNNDVFKWLIDKVKETGRQCVTIMISELGPDQVGLFDNDIEVWVQTSCPRLSIDWGSGYPKPLLTPYEAMLALMSDAEWKSKRPAWLCETSSSDCCQSTSRWDEYPMDFYSKSSLGPWTPNHITPEQEMEMKKRAMERKLALQRKLKQRQSTDSQPK